MGWIEKQLYGDDVLAQDPPPAEYACRTETDRIEPGPRSEQGNENR